MVQDHRQALLDLISFSQNSLCRRRKVAASAVDKTTGKLLGQYCNTPLIDCYKDGCYRIERNISSGTNGDICGCVHGEQALVCHHATELHNAWVYVTHKPCITCLRILIGCGVKDIYYYNDYPVDSGIFNKLIHHNNVNIKQIQIKIA